MRLLGFRAVLWDAPYRNRRNPERVIIKRLEPIVAKIPECSETSLMMETVPDISVVVNAGEVEETLAVPDTISSFYGNLDGFSLCGARTYALTENDYPAFLDFDGTDKLTITSEDENDVPVRWFPEL